MNHTDFTLTVKTIWDKNLLNLQETIEAFVQRMTAWNIETFQNIYKKKRTLARLAGIQKYLYSHNHPQL